ncbi:glycosyltransferase family 39 protein [Marixanthomonas ophiurae]|uniref:Uncharacterized protein n=1 Tax=Marixanthomonas ophiurae TaxID=387659 RepID=A0A3E1Q8W2_9FLAO|nr:glycosyltransferase family 39 protein [Marixanthomonas ophiurae]RFN58560.1 hypothetical protein DZ858_00290 [Marixanthomonas ophiurae]
MALLNFIDKQFNLCVGALFCTVSILVFISPIALQPDSLGYIDVWFNRTPVYPLFVNTVLAIFGDYYKTALKVLQLLLGLASVWFFITQLRKHISLQTFWYLLLTGILLIPYVYNHKIANNILTEAIAYPLYLLTTAHFLLFFFKEHTKNLSYALIFLFILLLTRKQFLYFVPIGLVILFWVSYKSKTFKRNIPHLIVLVLLPFVVSLTDSTYHKIVHGHFTNTPWTGIHLLAPAMYVADKEDVAIYTSEEEKAYFNAIYTEIEENNFNEAAAISEGQDVISHYIANFAKIANGTIYPIGKERYEKELSEDDALIKVDETTTAMAIPLIKDNFKKWLSLYIKNFSYGFENSKYVLLFVILFLFGISKINVSNTNRFKAIAFVTCVTISNIAIVAVGMHTLKRFTFYNDWVLFFVIFILLNSISTHYIAKRKTHL